MNLICNIFGHRKITRIKPESSIKWFCGRCMFTQYKTITQERFTNEK